MADLQFNMRYGAYEFKACPKQLVRFNDDEPNETINFIRHDSYEDKNGETKEYCYSIGYFTYDKKERVWDFQFVGGRFLMIGEDEITGVWEMLKAAYKVLDAWKMSEIHLDY